MIVQKILPHDPIQRRQFSEHRLNILEDDLAWIITSDEAHFHLTVMLITKTADIGQRKTLENCT